jgi:hypothetical protein
LRVFQAAAISSRFRIGQRNDLKMAWRLKESFDLGRQYLDSQGDDQVSTIELSSGIEFRIRRNEKKMALLIFIRLVLIFQTQQKRDTSNIFFKRRP